MENEREMRLNYLESTGLEIISGCLEGRGFLGLKLSCCGRNIDGSLWIRLKNSSGEWVLIEPDKIIFCSQDYRGAVDNTSEKYRDLNRLFNGS